MRRAAWRLRAAALLAPASLAVHDLRYAFGFGDPGQALAAQGHRYLGVLGPLLVLALAAGAGEFIGRLTRARGGDTREARPPRLRALWAWCAGILLTIYLVQESVEGLFAQGHPAGLAGLFGHGGWTAVLLALALGALVALALHGAHAAIVVAGRAAHPVVPAGLRSVTRPRPGRRPALGVLAGHLAGRGPPAVPA